MDVTSLIWISIFVFLFSTTFGTSGTICLLLYILSGIGGFLCLLYHIGCTRLRNLPENCFWHEKLHKYGLDYLLPLLLTNPQISNDSRITGSTIIDDALNEVLDYIVRDYVKTWYKKITDDKEFSKAVRLAFQHVIIKFSNRMKHIDLVPFITTTLVEDFASHIRLYRQSIDRVNEHKKDDTKPPADLEQIFFDLELDMEDIICHDVICLNESDEKQYLTELSEMMLYIFLPVNDFSNKSFRFITREILVENVFLPLINLLSDSDYVYQTIIWFCKDTVMSSDIFLTSLRQTTSIEELHACKEKVDNHIIRQRSKDTGGEDDTVIKQKLSSLLYVKTICDQKIAKLQAGIDNSNSTNVIDMKKFAGQRIYKLDFETVLNDNTALQYFREFLTSHGAAEYLHFYHTIECYKISAEQQISAALLAENCEIKPDLEMIRDAANNIYQQYLSEKAIKRLSIDEQLIRTVLLRIQDDEPNEHIFDEIQCKVWSILQEEKYFPSFRKSQLYFKLLRVLNLLSENKNNIDTINKDFLASPKPIKKCNSDTSINKSFTPNNSPPLSRKLVKENIVISMDKSFTLQAEITGTGVCREHGKSYSVYLINVCKVQDDGTQIESHDIYRRYSDFDNLHTIITDKYASLSGLALPKKKAFNNLSKDLVEKRKLALNAYLQTLLQPSLLNSHVGLKQLLEAFLKDLVWDNKRDSSSKVENFVNPIKAAFRSVPENVVDGVLKVSGGIRNIPTTMIDGVGKMINSRQSIQQCKPVTYISNKPYERTLKNTNFNLNSKAESKLLKDRGRVSLILSDDDQENIPVRILLLLLDEIFDLKNKNVWLRRRIDAILRQIIQSVMGDSINRKIIDHVELYTSSDQVAEYVKSFRDNLWPGGYLAEKRLPRNESTKLRTQLVCRAKMLAIISEELRHLIGTEAIHHGVNLLFTMFQHQTLNKRLIYVIIKSALCTIFPSHKFPEVFQKLHSSSPRLTKSARKKDLLKQNFDLPK